MSFFNQSVIFITGGTGSFGQEFIKSTLVKYNPKKIIIYSRDEMKQWNMAEQLKKYKSKLEFIIGDIRDMQRLDMATKGVDFIVHSAATKIVPTAEDNPFECIKTNVIGSMNVLNCAVSNNIKKLVALSTDKASSPINLYGASKLCADKLFVSGNYLKIGQKTKLSVVRYGNVMGSRGSVIPFFLKLSKKDKVPITDINMTRFMISLKEAIDLVWFAFQDMSGGEIYVKKIPSMKVTEIAKAINEKSKFKIIGIRPGEKIHEQMIGSDDSSSTYEYKSFYKIFPNSSKLTKKIVKKGKKVKESFQYSSNTNKEWMTTKDLKQWIKDNKKSFLEI
ncbi:UDP-N-acetylglucosamine 4,6-dehydratase (inverting) [Candidatus Pelagibacter sp.]|jgi:UDP-N-acetylglucosamine 4,6-dehydratase (inverting)|nr:UDP-N-acetylglucosamine 4,6-dehydratase (inverting) [Candidatus Pelagibacter sp.]